MGEMAEYMLNGDDCQGCGEHLGDGPGYPRFCAACGGQPSEGGHSNRAAKRKAKRKRQRARKRQAFAATLAGGLADTLRADGWVQHSPHHWQKRTPAGLLDYWPSTGKWSLGGHVRRGTYAEIVAALAEAPR